MKLLLSLVALGAAAVFSPCGASAQKLDTVLVKGAEYSTSAFPLPGTAFGTSKYDYEIRAAATRGVVLAFADASVGKVSGCRMLVAVKEGELLGCGAQTMGSQAGKKLLKQLMKQFGKPYGLTVTNKTEVLEWKPMEGQPFLVQYKTTADDSRSSVWITLR